MVLFVMRLDQPRIIPTVESDWDDDSRPLLDAIARNNGRVLNIFRTIARHPKLLKRWMVFGNHVLNGNSLPARERELVILRTGYLCGAGYEWAQHVPIARAAGITDDQIRLVVQGPSAPEWDDGDRMLLAATDELSDFKFIRDETWAALGTHWSEKQMMDLVFTVGQYTLVSMALNTFGVQLEDETER
ncbi:MAG: carboxymuconolactone decarboxylase family protein, partial [Ilumatobacteraceae bacterium]